MANVADIISYYVNLLIIQYHNQPKAQATIQLFAKELLANGVMLDVQNGYDIDTAVGAQLDIIGKYEGVDRFYSELNLTNYFSLIDYAESTSLPTSPPRFGFTDYADYESFQYNGTLIYDDIIAQNNALFDSDYRTLIKLKRIENNSNYSHEQIDLEMFNAFGSLIRPESLGHMTMQYFIDFTVASLVQAILAKKLLPKPMGVLLSAITGILGEMFALTDYSGYQSPFGYGFSNYSGYDAQAGQVLTYSQISEV